MHIVEFLNKLKHSKKQVGSYGTYENNWADNANSCDKLDMLTNKLAKFIT